MGKGGGRRHGHTHTEMCSHEEEDCSGIDAEIVEVVHFNSLVSLCGKLLSSGSFQYGLSHILFICHTHLFAITILKRWTIAASFSGTDWDTPAELLSHQT